MSMMRALAQGEETRVDANLLQYPEASPVSVLSNQLKC